MPDHKNPGAHAERHMLPQPEPKRVFCKDCRHLHRYHLFGDPLMPKKHDATCDKEPVLVSRCPISGEQWERVSVLKRNAGFDCRLFEPSPPPPAPTRPWWQFWSRI
jgi:hypothetical protein